jgi:hypothetical protein
MVRRQSVICDGDFVNLEDTQQLIISYHDHDGYEDDNHHE